MKIKNTPMKHQPLIFNQLTYLKYIL